MWSISSKILFVAFTIQWMNTSKDKITTSHDVSSPIWYLEWSDWKSSSITSFALSSVMISMLPLSECITSSSSISLGEIKLIAIVNWILHVSDFLRLFMLPFKYGLIFIKDILHLIVFCFYHCTFIFNIFIAPNISYCYCFIMIFFMLKKVFNL